MNKNLIASLSAILVIGLLHTGCESSSKDDKSDHDFGDNDPNIVLCIGDSITHGYELPRQHTYPAQLGNLLNRNVINAGVIGETSRDGRRRAASLLDSHKPGYLLILFGTNDVRLNDTIGTIQNLREMARSARSRNVIPILATLPPTSSRYAYMRDEIIIINARIRSMAKEENVRLADIERAFDFDSSLLADGIHPNREGMQKIALTFFDKIY